MGNHITNSFFRDMPTNFSRYVKRKTRRFNVIPRAEKYIDNMAEKPSKAPSYEATMKLVDKLMRENPNSLNEVKEKNEKLHSNLQNVYVTSVGENKDSFSKTLVDPSIEKRVYAQEYNDEIPVGRFNSTRAEHFLCAHQKDPQIYSPELLAEVYRIEPKAMRNIVDHVKVLTVIMPVKKIKKSLTEKLAREFTPSDMLVETEDQYMERKILEARDKFDEFFKRPLNKDETDRKLLTDMNLLEMLQVAPIKLLREKNMPTLEKMTEDYNLTDRELDQLTNAEAVTNPTVVKPEEFNFDEILKKSETKNTVKEISSGNQKIDNNEENENEDRYENEKRHQRKS